MIASVFRPSDDATVYLFHVPSNCFAVVSLEQLAHMLEALFGTDDCDGDESVAVRAADLADSARALAAEVRDAIASHAVFVHPVTGTEVYAYEVDGFGNALFMDDANVPSLLGLPYLGWCAADDPLYRSTRDFVLR